jgi:hypothetical protein
MLNPVPDKAAAKDITRGFESNVIVEKMYMARVEQHIPITEGVRVPILSAILPLNGPNSAMVAADGNIYKAARAVVIPAPDTKKKGNKKNTDDPAIKQKNLAKDPSEKDFKRKRWSGSSGFGVLPSQKMKIKRIKIDPPRPPNTNGENQPNLFPKDTDNINATKKDIDKITPRQSNPLFSSESNSTFFLLPSLSTIIAITFAPN